MDVAQGNGKGSPIKRALQNLIVQTTL